MTHRQDSLCLPRALGADHTHPSPGVVEGGEKEVLGFHAFPYGFFRRTWWHDASNERRGKGVVEGGDGKSAV